MDTVTAFKFISLLVIQAVAILGNFLMIVVGLKCKALRNFQNAFIFNMAFTDFLQGSLIMTSALVNVYHGSWTMDQTTCEVFGILKLTLTLSSVYSLSGTSVLRYFYVVKRTKRMNTMTKAVFCILASWCICVFLALTPLFRWGMLGFEDGKDVCTVLFHLNISHTMVVFVTGLFMNVVIMVACYIFIFRTLRRTNQRMMRNSTATRNDGNSSVISSPVMSEKFMFPLSDPYQPGLKTTTTMTTTTTQNVERYKDKTVHDVQQSSVVRNKVVCGSTSSLPRTLNHLNSSNNDRKNNNNSTKFIGRIRTFTTSFRDMKAPQFRMSSSFAIPTKELNLLKTISIIVIVFICCWTPYVLFNMVRMFGGSGDNNVLDTTTMWFGFVNSAVNPVIYGVMNNQFRNAMRDVLMCKCDTR